MSKKKKGGKKGGGPSDEDFYTEQIHMLDGQLQTLQQKFGKFKKTKQLIKNILLVFTQEAANKSKASEGELRTRVIQLNKDLDNEKMKLFSITSDMTRQYKQMQEDLKQQIAELQENLREKEETIKIQEQERENLQKDYDYKLKKKEDNIQELKRKIEDMSHEFSKMLRETLDKMQDRIEGAQWDTENDPQMIKKLKDVVGFNNNN